LRLRLHWCWKLVQRLSVLQVQPSGSLTPEPEPPKPAPEPDKSDEAPKK